MSMTKQDLLEIGKLFIEQSGDFSVTTIDSATAALDLLNKEQFDAIISDYQMPVMDGLQFLIDVRPWHETCHQSCPPGPWYHGRGRRPGYHHSYCLYYRDNTGERARPCKSLNLIQLVTTYLHVILSWVSEWRKISLLLKTRQLFQ